MQLTRQPNPNLTDHTASRPRRGITPAVAIASLALLAAGCGGSGPTTSTTQSQQSPVTAAFKYSSCMRSHGVTNFPDPRVSSGDGHQSIIVALPRSAVGSPAFAAASKACAGILPGPRDLSPQQQHAREQDLVAFARCLRGHGVPDFPDPDSQGRLTLEMISAAGVDLHAPAVLTAAKACIGVTHGAITGADVERAVNGRP